MTDFDDPTYPVHAMLDGEVLDNHKIRDMELVRARRALAYLKTKIGNAGMRTLLAEEIDIATRQVKSWVEASNGEWQSGAVELIFPGPKAKTFHAWFMNAMMQHREPEFRAGHPDHFLNHATPGHAEVIENVGADDYPWHIFLDFAGPDARFPTAWDDSFPERLGCFINDRDGLRVGSAIHEMRDASDGLHTKMTIHLPKAAPARLVKGHLEHFSIEFRNWTRLALSESGADA